MGKREKLKNLRVTGGGREVYNERKRPSERRIGEEGMSESM